MANQKSFLEEFARAILAWQEVEDNLYVLFDVLIKPQDHQFLSAAFYSIQGGRSKFHVVDNVCKVAFIATELESVCSKIGKQFSKRLTERNALAHFTSTGFVDASPSIGRSFFDSRLQGKNYREYDLEDLKRFRQNFSDLALELERFYHSADHVLTRHLSSPDDSPPSSPSP